MKTEAVGYVAYPQGKYRGRIACFRASHGSIGYVAEAVFAFVIRKSHRTSSSGHQGWSSGSLVRPAWWPCGRSPARCLRGAWSQIGGGARRSDQTARPHCTVRRRAGRDNRCKERNRRAHLITVRGGRNAQPGRSRNY